MQTKLILIAFLLLSLVGCKKKYEEGFNEGLSQGRADGETEGYDDGYGQGYDNTYQPNYDQAFTQGRDDGYAEGYSEGEDYFTENTSYDVGFNDGWNEGYASGASDGYESTYDDAYNAYYGVGYDYGYDNGIVDGYDDGYDAGYSSGSTAGYNDGYDDGYDDYYDDGWDDGYDDGYSDGYGSNEKSNNPSVRLAQLVNSDLINYSSLKKFDVETAVNLGTSHADVGTVDMEKIASLREQHYINQMKHQLALRFGLSGQRSREIAIIAHQFNTLSGSRELTEKDANIFAVNVIGVSLKSVEGAVKKSLKGDSSELNSMLNEIAKHNKTTPEKVNQIISEVFF